MVVRAVEMDAPSKVVEDRRWHITMPCYNNLLYNIAAKERNG